MKVSAVLAIVALVSSAFAWPTKRAEDAMDIVGCYGCPEEKREAMAEPIAVPEPEPEPEAAPEEDAMDIVGCYGCPEE